MDKKYKITERNKICNDSWCRSRICDDNCEQLRDVEHSIILSKEEYISRLKSGNCHITKVEIV